MLPDSLLLTAFWSKIGFFQPMGFKGPIMCYILCQFLFKEMGPYCLFLTAFWSKLRFFPYKGFEGLIMFDTMGQFHLVFQPTGISGQTMCYMLRQFLFKEMGPYCLFLTAFWSELGFFQPMGFKGQKMCYILCQFLFKEMGPYCLFLTAFWSKLRFSRPMGFDGLIMCDTMG